MKAIIATKQTDAPRSSHLQNCHLVVKHKEAAEYLFYFPDPAESPGDVIVSLDGYLICPIEVFSPRQLKMALKKYRLAGKSANGQFAD